MTGEPTEPAAVAPGLAIRLQLQLLHAGAGEPSYRSIAARSGTSHTTVAQLLTGRRAAGATTWDVIGGIAEALGASKAGLDELRRLHGYAVRAERPRTAARLISGPHGHRPQAFTQRDCDRGELAEVCTRMSAEGWKLAGLVPGEICTVLFSRPAEVQPG